LPPQNQKPRVNEWLERLSIDHLAYRSTRHLSGGEAQRVSLARAFVLEPEILFLDEPFSSLDSSTRENLLEVLGQILRSTRVTTVFVTHDQEEALTLSDRVAIFNKGQIEQVGTPFEIYNKSASRFVCDFIGDINILKRDIVREINAQSSSKLDENKDALIRLETIFSEKKDGYVRLRGTVKDSEYDGIFTKYNFEVLGQTLKNIEKNDGIVSYQKGSQVDLYINPTTVMQF
jgi:iron(III) transport system ATP-binding protein